MCVNQPLAGRDQQRSLAADGDGAALPTVRLLFVDVGLLFDAVWFYVTRNRQLLAASAPASFITASRRRYFLGPILYAAATLLSLVAPYVALVGYVLLILFYWLPPQGERPLPA